MSSIAYITDSKLLELHRLNRNKEMNFWRLTTTNRFTDFEVGDLLFFLSKDKEHMRKKEKGIVGYGRAAAFESYALNTMWKKYGELNGYRTKESFKEAIAKVSKEHKIPSKISSIYLKDVVFFQSPIYLSDCGMNISNRVESFVYLDSKGETSFKILDQAKGSEDLWSSKEAGDDLTIEKEQIRGALYSAYNDIKLTTSKNIKRSHQELLKYILPKDGFAPIKDSRLEGYRIVENNLTIVFAPLFLNNKHEEYRILIGQANYYRLLLSERYPYDFNLEFKTSNNDQELENLLNKKGY